jgi:crotonobetainyl-CoA:carnitine CoA-transferase CaiB-like acyl-CoA transferase
VRAIDRPELATDPRFADHASLMANSDAAVGLTEVFAAPPSTSGAQRLADFTGQWAIVQNTIEAAADPQTIANGYIQDCRTAAGTRSGWWRRPCSSTRMPAARHAGPEFNEHGDAILTDLGFDWDAIVDLKVRGVVA